ncbi:hypothetical protein [uncultured Enterococcus sp.]|uniref:hypothetical protein n=1 Tax=uncultured Enterococcus sp. TaxID=167972 RepID=UPI002AA6D0F0|nr:hypothetical protein [uncultured Enterococcus sp.]
MGQRANLIIVENNEYTLYYDHWAANSLDSYLFWGPERAAAFFRDHEKSGEEYWLDTVWCEGGAVIDLDLKVLLFFGGEDIYYDIPLRKMYLKVLKAMWPGYLIKWAFNGVLDLAAYVSYNQMDQLGEPAQPMRKADLESCFIGAKGRELEGVLSVTNQRIVSIHPFFGYDAGSNILWSGEQAGKNIKKQTGHSHFEFPDLSTESYADFAREGIHLDFDNHMLFYWLNRPLVVLEKQLELLWPNWTIVNLLDDYKKHETLTQMKLTFSGCDNQKLIEQIRKIVCRTYRDEADAAENLVVTLEENGKIVQVSPFIHATNLFDMPVALREHLFDDIINEMK